MTAYKNTLKKMSYRMEICNDLFRGVDYATINRN